MLSEELLAQVVGLINSNECLSSKQNIELMSDVLMQIKHFYTLIRYENQKEYLVKFMKKMKLRHVRKGEILYKKGVANENLYLILDGLFSLWEPKQQDEINNEISLISKIDKLSKISQPSEDIKHKIANTQLHLDLFRKKEDDMLLKHQQESYFLTENICAFKRIRYSAAGESLNEECVISGSKTQNIAVAQSDSILIYISSGEYLEIFDLEINKLNFITEVLIKNFPKANSDSVRRLAYKFKEEVFPYGSMLFHQEDPSKVFIIIKSGQVEISKLLFPEDSVPGQSKEKSQKKIIENQKTQMSEQQKDKSPEIKPSIKEKDTKKKNGQQAEDEQNYQEYEKYYGSDEENEKKKLQQEEDEIKIALEKQKAEMNIEQGIGGQSKGGRKKLRVQQTSVMAPVKFIKSSQCLRLGIIGPGEILGLEDLIKHRPRSFQAKSIAADTLIYYITKKKIDDIIDLNEDKQLKKAMRDSADVKNEWYGDMQQRIQKLNGMSNQNNLIDKESNAKHIKNKMKEESELTFKAVVQKLIEDRRSKIIKDSEKKRNKSTNDMNNDYNEGYHKNEGNNDDEKIGKEELEKIRLVKLAEEKNKLNRKNQKSTSQDNQPSSNLLIPSQRNLKRVSDIIDKQEQPQQLDSLQVILADSQQKQRKYQYQGSSKQKNDLDIKRNIFNSNSEQKPTAQTGQEIELQSLDSKSNLPSKQPLQQNHLHPLQEYENRFTTIFPQEQTNYQQQQLQESHVPIIVPSSPDNSSKDQLLRNYKLETSQLSLKQKIQYRIQSNIEIASRFKKYNAESSKGFIETRKFVAKLRQSSKQKEQLSGQNQIQSQKEDQLEQIMNLVNKVNNNTSLDAGTIKSKTDQETHHNKRSSLSFIPDHSYNNNIHTRNLVNNNQKGKKSSNHTTNLSFLEEEQIGSSQFIQGNIYKDQSHPQFPAVISSMSLIPQDSRLHNRYNMSNHIPESLQSFSQPLIQASFNAFPSEKLEKNQKLQKNKQPSLLLSQQSSNEKTRTQQQQQQILDLSHPLPPTNSSNHQVTSVISPFKNINSSSLASHLSIQSQRIASPLRQINQFNSQTAINSHPIRSSIHDVSQQSISTLLSIENNHLKDIIEDNRKTQSSSQRNQQKYPEKERLQLPPIISSSFSLANNLSPQISFSVKMSRKHINAKFNSVYHPSNVDSQNAICLSDRNIGQNQQNPQTTKMIQKNDKEKHALQQKYLPQQLSYPSQPLFNSESHFSSRHQNQDNSNYQGQVSRAQYRQQPKALHLSHQREITPQKSQLPSFFLVKSQLNQENLKEKHSIDERKTNGLSPSKDALAKVLQVSIKDIAQNN